MCNRNDSNFFLQKLMVLPRLIKHIQVPLRKQKRTLGWFARQKAIETRFVQSYACHDRYDFVQKYSASTYNSTHPRYILPARTNDSVRHNRAQSRKPIEELSTRQQNDRKTQWEKHTISLPCYLRNSWTFSRVVSFKIVRKRLERRLPCVTFPLNVCHQISTTRCGNVVC